MHRAPGWWRVLVAVCTMMDEPPAFTGRSSSAPFFHGGYHDRSSGRTSACTLGHSVASPSGTASCRTLVPSILPLHKHASIQLMLPTSPSKRLCYSAATNNVSHLKHLIETKKFDFDNAYHNHMTPLIAACAASQYDAVLYLLSRGADIDRKDKKTQKTALMHAVVHGHLQIVETLLNNGCDVFAID